MSNGTNGGGSRFWPGIGLAVLALGCGGSGATGSGDTTTAGATGSGIGGESSASSGTGGVGGDGGATSSGVGGEGGAPTSGVGGSGVPPKEVAPYPAGPYGYAVGSTIENYAFMGFADASLGMTLQTIALADFYNPTGTDVYPPSSPYGEGKSKPTALLLFVAAVWAGPANYEAQAVLPPLYEKYRTCRGEFLVQLHDGPTPGQPAMVNHLTNWTTKYDVNYPATIDPAKKLSPIFAAAAYPANIIVDTRTMTIVDAIAGVPTSGFWSTFDAVIGDVSACIGP